MRSKLLNKGPERTIALVFDQGDEVISGLQDFAAEQHLSASRLTGIGAFQSATLGYFDWEQKAYERIPVDEQVEVLALVGDITLEGLQPKVHVHVVLGRRNGHAVGGHLLQAQVRPTLELMLVESPRHLQRHHDAASGLALIRLDV